MPRAPIPRQRKNVLVGLANGLSPQEMADGMVLSRGTIATHVQLLFKQLGVHDRGHAVGVGLKLKLIEPRHIVARGHCPGPDVDKMFCRCLCFGCKKTCRIHQGEYG